MRRFSIRPEVYEDLAAALDCYDGERVGLSDELVAEVDRVLARIERRPEFVTAPIERLAHGVIRREFVDRFPYRVFFIETPDARRVIALAHDSMAPATWKQRV